MTRVELAGARVLLTGATGGIGQAIARRVAGEGAQLVLTARRPDALHALARDTGSEAVVAELTRREEVEALLRRAGEIDVLIANAAMPGSGRLGKLDRTAVDRALEVNLRAPIALAHGLLPGMVERGRGQLVFIGSLSGRAATAGSSVYNATKFGLRGFALSLREEVARSGVGVSLVAPGFVSESGMYARTQIKLPLGVSTRTPEQVADAVIRAIREDRGEIDVASVAMRLGADFAGLAPALAARASRALGGEALARQFEQRQAGER